MKLRDYQGRCHDAIIEAWKEHQAVIAVLATGLGKTVIFSHTIKSTQPKRSIVLAHREELVWQAREKIEKVTGLPCEVEMADLHARRSLFHDCPVVVATVQSMVSGNPPRMTKFRPQDFGYVYIDECHHSTARTYTKIIDYFKQNPELRILGVTATPDRADEESLRQVFGHVAFNYDILDGIQNGWLVDVTQQFVSVSSLDFSHIHTTAGDLNGGELAMLMENERNIQGVCHPTLEVVYGLPPKTLNEVPVDNWTKYLTELNREPRRSIVFTASVVQAEMCCNILNRAVPGIAEWVCGKTNKDMRRAILGRFSTGKTPIVVNCGVLTEGFDNPYVECIMMARPTKSRSLYCQMVGRSTRSLPGLVDHLETPAERRLAIGASAKPYCRIVDFVGNSGRHKLITCFDVLGGKITEKAANRAIKNTIEAGKPVRVCRTLTKTEAQVEKEDREERERQRLKEEARKKRFIARVKFRQQQVDPFDNQKPGPQQTFHMRVDRPPSDKMKKIMRAHGYNPERFNFQQTLIIIGKIAKKEGWNLKVKSNGKTTSIR